MNRVYLDHAATTAVSPEVLETMLPFFTGHYGNPSSIHATGRDTRKAVEAARKQVAAAIHAASHQEIYFTSGGSESDNWAIKGAAFANRTKGNHIITTQIEHHAVLHTCEWLEKQGFQVTYLPVNREGFVDPVAVREAITDHTILISIMTANNEIGTIEPIAEIGTIAKEKNILFHTDAVQAVGAIPIDVQAMQVDMLSLSGHKLYGPKGVGALYIRKGIKLDSLVHGGAQERGIRAGTENVPAIVGLGKAAELSVQHMTEQATRIAVLRDQLVNDIMKCVPDVTLNGAMKNRLPNNTNLSFKGIEGESLLLRLDLAGVAASGGSACTSGSLDPSHVLTAIGCPEEAIRSSIRFTLGAETTETDIQYVIDVLPGIVQSLRDMTQ